MNKTTRVWVYKGHKKPDTYLYLPVPDDFSRVPEAVVQGLGRLTLALHFELDSKRRLARADPAKVLAALKEHGFYLQLPDPNQHLEGVINYR